eukprot:TRINITY_DN1469_c1_g1_i1.p1 TRINITY_DN1469_c1_g1~~TRINITY_DN1469_c1_g1_i1.p1  ORF type:complete len:310 (+),score=83.54 TRINITY_DN1469_c1_g1_i1:92-1021(+)
MSAAETIESLEGKIKVYKSQKSQVNALLTADPENSEYQKLLQDINDCIGLTTSLLAQQKADAEKAKIRAGTETTEEETKKEAQFKVGDKVEVKNETDGGWYPGVIREDDGSLMFTVQYIGYGGISGAVHQTQMKLLKNFQPVQKKLLIPGATIKVKYSPDSKWYKASLLEVVGSNSYKINYTEYSQTETVPYEYITEWKATDNLIAVPTSLHILPTDSEKDIKRKKKRINAIKYQNRKEMRNQEQEERAKSWKDFMNKGSKKRRSGFMAPKVKKSMFATPTSIEGKVGVIGSGNGMTAYNRATKVRRVM